MKHKINKLHFGILVLFALAFSACSDNDPKELFDDNPSTRINDQIDLVRNTLLSAKDGWKVTYFTNDNQLGGFTYLIKFLDEQNVEMDSDFGSSKGTVTQSKWDIKLGSTVKLSFTTANKIHELSDSNTSPDDALLGQGYQGSIEFLYYGTDGNDLVFRANKRSNEVRFTRATADDWVNLAKNDDVMASISGELAYQIGDNISFFNYNPERRFATNSKSEITDKNFGIGFTSNGIIISPSITPGNGKSYSKFTLNNAKTEFVSEDGEFTIFLLKLPFNINQDWTIDVRTDISPALFTTFLDIYNANRARWGENLSAIIFFGNTTVRGATTPGIMFNSQGFLAQHTLNFSGSFNHKDQVKINKNNGAFNWSFYTHLLPFVDAITDNTPFKVELTPTVNPTEVKLTSVDNPDIWFIIKK